MYLKVDVRWPAVQAIPNLDTWRTLPSKIQVFPSMPSAPYAA